MQFKPEKKLGFGLMRLPVMDGTPRSSAIDIEQMKQMVDYFMDHGFTYFDTAWMYMGFESENAARVALVERYPRESFTLASKLHTSCFESFEDRDTVFNKQLEKTGAGYFDYYLIHGVNSKNIEKYEKYDCFKWQQEKKAAGLIKHAGFSFHDKAEVLDKVLTDHPEAEFVQLQLNYLDWESASVQSRACYEVCVKHGKPVVVMEPVKGGSLAKIPADGRKLFAQLDPDMSMPSWAVRFAASLDNVMVVLSGMSSIEQMQDNASYMDDFKPLSEEEKATCLKVAGIINDQITIPCTGCSYCVEGCPQQIPIPRYFSLYNEDMREYPEKKELAFNLSKYAEFSNGAGKASDCAECGQCEDVCPQQLPIIKYMKDVAEHYEKK
jgi:uncharacterized protein